MALQVTKADAKRIALRYEGIKRRIAGIKEKAEETTERLVGTAETAGAAFAMGVVQGKTGGVELFGVPMELGLGLGLTAFGLMGGAGKHSQHLVNLGGGCLAAYATTLGRGVGTTWKTRGSLSSPSVSGLSAGNMGMGLTPLEVAQAARAMG